MKPDDVIIIKHWKDVLLNYVDPIRLMENLKTLFELGKPEYSRVYENRNEEHVAVGIALDIIMKSDILLDELIEAIHKSGSKWLAMLISGDIGDNDVSEESRRADHLSQIRRFLTSIAPHIKSKIDAQDVAEELRAKEVITPEECECVACRYREEGKSRAAIKLLSFLVRKTDEWLVEFIEVMENQNYDEKLIQSLKNIAFCQTQTVHNAGALTEMQSFGEKGSVGTKAITGKRAEHLWQIRKLVTSIAPQIKSKIDARDVAEQLRAKAIITPEECECVKYRYREEGRSRAASKLLAILVCKTDEWLVEFIEVLENQNYDDKLIQSLKDIASRQTQTVCYAGTLTEIQSFGEKESADLEALSIVIHPKTVTNDVNFTSPIINTDEKPTVRQKIVAPKLSSSHLREYQVHLASRRIEQSSSAETCDIVMPRKSGCSNTPLTSETEKPSKENSIIFVGQNLNVLPDIIKRHFPNNPDSVNRKICFLVPEITENCDSLKSIFATEKWSVEFYHDECSASASASLDVLMRDSQIIVMTAYSLLQWLSSGSDMAKMTEFDMLIFDECGQACQDGPYRELLLKYLYAKRNSCKVSLPQIIGLATSDEPGKILSQSNADKYIQELAVIFDARGGIEILECEASKTPFKSVSSKRKGTKESIIITDPFIFYLCKTIDSIVDQLYKLQIGRIKNLRRPLSISKGTPEYLKWCNDLMKKADLLGDETQRSDIKLCAKFLNSFNVGLLIKNKCRSVDAANILTRDLENKILCLKTEASLRLVEQRMMQISINAQEDLKAFPFDKDVRDPSSIQKIKNKIMGRKSGQIFVFVQDTEIVEALQLWMTEDIELRNFIEEMCVSVFICHRNDALANPSPCDLVICYDCRLPPRFGAKGESPIPKPFGVKSTALTANDKTKFSKSLLISQSVKIIQQKRKENKQEFSDELDQFQAVLLSRNSGSCSACGSKHCS